MSARTDAFGLIAQDYDFRRTTNGAFVVVPTDSTAPQVAEPLEALVYDWMHRISEAGIDIYGQGVAVLDMGKAHARQVTQYSQPIPVATRVHQYTGDDGRPRVSIDLGDRHGGLTVQVGPSGWYVHDPRVED